MGSFEVPKRGEQLRSLAQSDNEQMGLHVIFFFLNKSTVKFQRFFFMFFSPEHSPEDGPLTILTRRIQQARDSKRRSPPILRQQAHNTFCWASLRFEASGF